MDWLQRLLLNGAPENTTLRAADWDLRGVFPWWVALLILAVGSAGVVYLYAHEGSRLSLFRRFLLAGLRIAAIALVLIMLLRPVLLAEFHGERTRPVVLLIDNTESMKQADRRLSEPDRLRLAIAQGLVPPDSSPSDSAPLASIPPEQLKDQPRVQLVKSLLTNPRLNLLRGMRSRGPLQPFLFGRKVGSPLEASADGKDTIPPDQRLLDSLTAEESQTALADAIHELLVRGGDLPTAIVIVTDGRDNASKRTLEEAARECHERGVPLHIYGAGSAEGGILQIKEVAAPSTIFVDDKPDAKDDPVEVPIRWRCRGFKQGTAVVTLTLGSQVIQREFPVREGEDLREVITFTPEKGKEEKRPLTARIEIKGHEEARDQVERMVQVKNSKVKVLYVENLPRREFKFIQPVLERDRRVLARFYLFEGDPKLAQNKPDPVSGAMFLEKFPENFPDAAPRDPDSRPYDLLILGDVPSTVLGKDGPRAIQKFVKEGGGLIVIAGQQHAPADYVNTPLAEVLPVEFTRMDFRSPTDTRTQPFKPVLTYNGEQSNLLALADNQTENLKLWKEDLWKDAQGFFWHYPVTGLRPSATSLLVHPELKIGAKADEKPMPLIASQYYGKGEVLFMGTDETWRWRHNAGDRLMARFWGQAVAQMGLPHLLGNSQRVQLELERAEAVLGRPGSVKARLLDNRYDPLTVETVPAKLYYLDAKDGERKERPIEFRRIRSQPGEYRAALPHDSPGRFELKVEKGASLEAASLLYRVDLPPRHELEVAGMAEEALRGAAQTSGGQFYREETLHLLVDNIEPSKASFVQRQEVLLWNPLALILFVGLVTAEWVLRKFSNLS
jgi:hypothetical protein